MGHRVRPPGVALITPGRLPRAGNTLRAGARVLPQIVVEYPLIGDRWTGRTP